MPEVLSNGQVIYKENEQIPSSDQLLARGFPVGSTGIGRERVAKATDLSPVRPKKSSERKNELTQN